MAARLNLSVLLGQYPHAKPLRGGDVSAEEIESTPDQRGRVPAGKAVAAGWSDVLVRCLGAVSEYAVRQWISRVPVDLADIKRDNREFLDG